MQIAAATGARTSISTTARELMYRANWYPDRYVNQFDVRGGSKLGAALMQLAGSTSLDEDAVRGVVERYAGADRRIGSGERTKLLDDIAAITRTMPKAGTPKAWPAKPPLGVHLRWIMAMSDVDFDGRISTADVRRGSEWASAVLELADGVTSLDEGGVERAARRAFPSDDPVVSVMLLSNVAVQTVSQRASVAMSIPDIARAHLQVFDGDQDLRLSTSDGRSAAITLAMLGASKQAVGVDSVIELLQRFDVRSADGSAAPDGRIDPTEMRTYNAARRTAGAHVPTR